MGTPKSELHHVLYIHGKHSIWAKMGYHVQTNQLTMKPARVHVHKFNLNQCSVDAVKGLTAQLMSSLKLCGNSPKIQH